MKWNYCVLWKQIRDENITFIIYVYLFSINKFIKKNKYYNNKGMIKVKITLLVQLSYTTKRSTQTRKLNIKFYLENELLWTAASDWTVVEYFLHFGLCHIVRRQDITHTQKIDANSRYKIFYTDVILFSS